MKVLEIILGPTGVGKTDWAIERALRLGSPVISCDSRQLYREMSIGTAVPSAEQLAAVRHYFIQDHSVGDMYTAGMYELEAMDLVTSLFAAGHDTLVMCGGSPFYIDAFCNGLDAFPESDLALREQLMDRLASEGLPSLVEQLRSLDPVSAGTLKVDNPQRVVRALEVCLMTGRPFSSFKTATAKPRDFIIRKVGLMRDRQCLYSRIDERARRMFDEGLVEEVRGLLPLRQRLAGSGLTALQTVGYSEVFSYLDGEISIDRALELVQRNSRRYARRQMSWWRRDSSIEWHSL